MRIEAPAVTWFHAQLLLSVLPVRRFVNTSRHQDSSLLFIIRDFIFFVGFTVPQVQQRDSAALFEIGHHGTNAQG
jgi:hypothetical protein